jgi:TRAP-type C4-dicarboxylate transport system permease small subunit
MKLAQLPPQEGTEVINGVATIKGFEWIFRNVVTMIIGFAGIALFILLLAGGFKYLTSGGNPESVASAQKTITYALIGLVIIALAFLILIFIQTFTGANVTVFTVNQ